MLTLWGLVPVALITIVRHVSLHQLVARGAHCADFASCTSLNRQVKMRRRAIRKGCNAIWSRRLSVRIKGIKPRRACAGILCLSPGCRVTRSPDGYKAYAHCKQSPKGVSFCSISFMSEHSSALTHLRASVLSTRACSLAIWSQLSIFR